MLTTAHHTHPSPPDVTPHAEVRNVTPALAEAWMKCNTRNRNLSQAHVETIKADLESGNWLLTPDAIAFDDHGVLINGQHRLQAIIESGISAPCIVATGLSHDSFVVTDDGRRRTFGDVLHIEHIPNWSGVAATVALVMIWTNNGDPRGTAIRSASNGNRGYRQLTKREKKDLYDLDPKGFQDATAAGNRLASTISLPASWWGAAMYLFTQQDAEDAAEFEHMLRTGETSDGTPLRSDHPARQLRESILRDAASPRPTLKQQKVLAMALIVKAWNYFRKGEPVKLLKFRTGGARPESFPEVL